MLVTIKAYRGIQFPPDFSGLRPCVPQRPLHDAHEPPQNEHPPRASFTILRIMKKTITPRTTAVTIVPAFSANTSIIPPPQTRRGDGSGTPRIRMPATYSCITPQTISFHCGSVSQAGRQSPQKQPEPQSHPGHWRCR